MINIELISPQKTKEFVVSVNGKVGEVKLNAADVGALPADTHIPSIEGLATVIYVDQQIKAIPKVDLTDYALKTEIPDVSGYQTAEQVEAAITAALGEIGVAEDGEF